MSMSSCDAGKPSPGGARSIKPPGSHSTSACSSAARGAVPRKCRRYRPAESLRKASVHLIAPRGTDGSNPASSSRQSVSHGSWPAEVENPGVSRGCAGHGRRRSRQRRA
jgi:hypothetical protein